MAHLFPIFGFSVRFGYRFRIGDRRFSLGSEGVRALELLAELNAKSATAAGLDWLLPLRGTIREIERLNSRAALTLVILRAPTAHLRRLAIWLRGRSGGYLGTSNVARHGADPDPAVRKEVARCLNRMSAWADLRQMERCDPDARVRRFAAQKLHQSYEIRLRSFSSHVVPRKVSPEETPLLVADDVDVRAGRPPKPDWMIRMILERIHRLVAGLAGPKKCSP